MRSELAPVHLVQKNYDKAAHYLEDAVKQAPNDAALLSRLGEAYLGSKKVAEAEGIFKRLLNIDPNSEDARVQMGRVYLMRDDLDRAHDEFLPVVDKMVARKEADKAAGLLQQIVQKDPQHVKSLARLVEIYRQFSKEGALGSAYSQLIEAYINEGQYAEAAEALEALVAREPQNQQHKTKLEFVRGKLAGGGGAAPGRAASSAAAPAPVDDIEFDLSVPDEAPAPPPSRPRPRLPPPPAPARGRSAPRSRAPPSRCPGRSAKRRRSSSTSTSPRGRCSASTASSTRRPTSSRPWSRASPTTSTPARSCARSTARRDRAPARRCTAWPWPRSSG